MPRKARDICDTDICTSAINEDYLQDSDIPGTEDLSEELSAMMKGTSNSASKSGDEAKLLKMIEDASNKLLTTESVVQSHSHRSGTADSNVQKAMSDVKGDVYRILKVVKGLDDEVKMLKNKGGTESSRRSRRHRTSSVTESDVKQTANSVARHGSGSQEDRLSYLEDNMRELQDCVKILCDKCDSEPACGPNKAACGIDVDMDDKLYNFIHCQINQRMDNLMDLVSCKFEEIEEKIKKLRNSIGIVSGCR